LRPNNSKIRCGSVLPATSTWSISRVAIRSTAARLVASPISARVPYALLAPSSRDARFTASPITV
jgi:hypothetical protein